MVKWLQLRHDKNITLCSAPARTRRAHEQHQRSIHNPLGIAGVRSWRRPSDPGPGKTSKIFQVDGGKLFGRNPGRSHQRTTGGGGANGRPQKRRILQFSLRTLALKPCSNHARTMLETLSGSTRFLLKLKFSHRVIFFYGIKVGSSVCWAFFIGKITDKKICSMVTKTIKYRKITRSLFFYNNAIFQKNHLNLTQCSKNTHFGNKYSNITRNELNAINNLLLRSLIRDSHRPQTQLNINW